MVNICKELVFLKRINYPRLTGTEAAECSVLPEVVGNPVVSIYGHHICNASYYPSFCYRETELVHMRVDQWAAPPFSFKPIASRDTSESSWEGRHHVAGREVRNHEAAARQRHGALLCPWPRGAVCWGRPACDPLRRHWAFMGSNIQLLGQ